MSGGFMALVALLLTGTLWAVWWQKIQAVRVPPSPTAFQIAHMASILLAVSAILAGGVPATIVACIALLGSGMWLLFSFTRAMDHKIPSIKVGDPIVNFTAPDAEGVTFDLASLQGQPFLLKFFRGFW